MNNMINVLRLSTGHVDEATGQYLDNTPRENWNVCGGPWTYGWFMYAHDEPQDQYPPCLWACFEYARAHGASYILFDCDEPTIPELPVYEW